MTGSDALDIASELANIWIDLWYLYAFVVTALVGVVTAMQQHLTDKYAGLLVTGFLAFASMHGVSLTRHYQAFYAVQAEAPDSVITVVNALGPPDALQLFSSYAVTVGLAVAAIRWQVANPGTLRQRELPLWAIVAVAVILAVLVTVITANPVDR